MALRMECTVEELIRTIQPTDHVRGGGEPAHAHTGAALHV